MHERTSAPNRCSCPGPCTPRCVPMQCVHELIPCLVCYPPECVTPQVLQSCGCVLAVSTLDSMRAGGRAVLLTLAYLVRTHTSRRVATTNSRGRIWAAPPCSCAQTRACARRYGVSSHTPSMAMYVYVSGLHFASDVTFLQSTVLNSVHTVHPCDNCQPGIPTLRLITHHMHRTGPPGDGAVPTRLGPLQQAHTPRQCHGTQKCGHSACAHSLSMMSLIVESHL